MEVGEDKKVLLGFIVFKGLAHSYRLYSISRAS